MVHALPSNNDTRIHEPLNTIQTILWTLSRQRRSSTTMATLLGAACTSRWKVGGGGDECWEV